jgi:hypothetical protein
MCALGLASNLGEICADSANRTIGVSPPRRATRHILVLHRALPDLERIKLLLLCGRVVGPEVGILFGAIKPDF